MSDQPSQESVDSTLDSSEQECQSNGNAKPTPTAEKSSDSIGPESHASTTYELWVSNQRRELRQMPVAPALAQPGGLTQTPFLLERGSPSTSSPAASHAKISALPDDEPDSAEAAQDFSLSSPESPMTLFGTEDGSSLRTFPDSFPQVAEEISESFSRRWPKSGFTTSLGECWTADTSECPNDGGEFSSLQDVLETGQVQSRFYLSPKAAAGILRRAIKRGRELPAHLDRALRELSQGAEGVGTA